MSAVQCFLARVASQPLVPQLALHAVRMVLAPHVLSEGTFPAGLATFDALQLRHFFCTAHVLALPEEKRHESRKYVSRSQTVTTNGNPHATARIAQSKPFCQARKSFASIFQFRATPIQ